MRIILASQSPFRKKALEILGLKYEIIPSNFDEKSLLEDNHYRRARLLAESKARTIGERETGAVIVAADLFVVFKNKINEKPKSKAEAYKMLKSYSGNKLDIVGGLAVYNSKSKKMYSCAEKYTVKWRKLNEYEIRDYIRRYPVTNLAGAFEGDALLRFAESTSGKYPFLTGLPLSKLVDFLRRNNIKV